MMKTLTAVVIGLTCFQAVLAQTNPPESMDAEQAEILAMARKLSRVSLTYRMAASQQMLDEVNFFAGHLKLPTPHPITLHDAKNIYVTPLWYGKKDSSDTNLSKADRIRHGRFFTAGVIATTNFDFGISYGRLWTIQRTKLENENSILELYPELIKARCLIDTNGAYDLAAQWLASVSIDVATMERQHKPIINQWRFNGKPEDLPKSDWMPEPPKSTNVTMLPIFDVQWGPGEGFVAKVTVIGTTKELFKLEVRDESLSKRPLLIITNAVELNANPEPPMKRLQRTEPQGVNSTSLTNQEAEQPHPFRKQIQER